MPSVSSKDDSDAHASGAILKKCITCGEDKSITKFKTNGNDKDGNRTRMATCRDCTEAKKAPPKPASPPSDGCSSTPSHPTSNSSISSSSRSSDMVVMKKLQAIECAINAIKEM